MYTKDLAKRFLALLCTLAMLGGSLSPAVAGMVGTDQILAAEQRQADRDRLIITLSRDDVRQQLTALGVDPDRALERVSRMTDAEVAELNQRMNDLPAGADGGTVLAVALVIFIVFVITDAIGATDIFPFIRPVN